MLGVLRETDADAGGPPSYAPAPGLDDLERLVDEVEGAGLNVNVTYDGARTELPRGVDLTAYRIVQEALTNVMKHAGPASATVRVGYEPGELGLEIVDDGRGVNGRDDGRSGHGLLGMRERVAVYGGTLDAGPKPGGGFRVAVAAPLRSVFRRGASVIRVAVADDQALVRSGFVVLLGSAADIEVVGEAADGVEAVALVQRERPDVVLMDIRMPDMDGLEATRRIVGAPATASTRVLILTTFDHDEYVFESLRAGASGFLLKDTLPVDLLAAIRVVADGDALLAPKVTRRLIEQFTSTAPVTTAVAHPGIDDLTEREREILLAVASGMSNAEIAEAMFISHATAKTHVSRLLTKLLAARPGAARDDRLRVGVGDAGREPDSRRSAVARR